MLLNVRSEKNLAGVHPDLVKVVRKACLLIPSTDPLQFIVTCGVRTMAEQVKLVAAGASQTLNSRHIPGHDGYGKAVDIACTLNGEVRWDWGLYPKIAAIFKSAANELMIPIEWGGDWVSFKDGPHFQLKTAMYP